MQGLIFAATTGVGLFLGTQLAGFAMDKYSVNGKFQWPKIWAFPLVITLAGTLVFATAFQGTRQSPRKAGGDGDLPRYASSANPTYVLRRTQLFSPAVENRASRPP